MNPSISNKRQEYAWAFYDWANSAYATVVMVGFFPIFFRNYWSMEQESSAITLHLGIANASASVLIMLLAPLLGAIADQCAARKRFLLLFAVLGAAMTAALFFVAQGQWLTAVFLYIAATIGFMGGNVFYDALIVGVSTRERYDIVSALGYALGYLGGGLLFALCVLLTLFPQRFGLHDAAQALRVSFLLVALWWVLFSIPLALMVRELPSNAGVDVRRAVRGGCAQLLRTLREIRGMRPVAIFLLAYWLYIDGVDTIARMAVDYGLALGFGSNDLIIALLITQFIAFPSVLVFGRLGHALGTRRGIYIAIGVYVMATAWAAAMDQAWEFYVLAVMIGMVIGGIQSLSRAFYARLIPPDRAAEFFGFYNVMGKFAAVLGPLMIGWIGVLSGNPRVGLISIIVLFIAGALLLRLVDTENTGSANETESA